jgi:hypothetical protein
MGADARVHGHQGRALWALRCVASVVPVVAMLGAVTPVFAAPVAGARYSGMIIPHGVGKLGVGFMPTNDRRSFEPPGARDWQGAHVRASRSLPCVGGDEWQFGGPSGTRVTSSGFAVRRTAGHGQKTLRLRGRFVGRSRAIVRLELRSARRGGCVFRARFVTHVTYRLKGSCTPRGTKTLASSTTGRVFLHVDADDVGAYTGHAYGCLFASRERFSLSEDVEPDLYVSAAATVGSTAALAIYECPTDCGGRIAIIDLTTAQTTREDEVDPLCNQPTDQPPEVSTLVLAPSLSYAYIADPEYGDRSSPSSVKDVVKNVAGTSTLLDCGTAIAPKSLTLADGTLMWSNGGQPRTAPLE